MINAIIIDDEPINIINLQRLLEQHCKQVIVSSTATSADEGVLTINKHQPDLVFLDIQMPGKNGFEMLQELHAPNFELIFVTAYDQYGIQAVKFAAIDYLLKPLNIDELKSAVSKVADRINEKKQNLQLSYLVDILRQGQQKEKHRIALPSTKATRFVFATDIIRCESSNSYTTFYMSDGEKIIVSVSIYEYEEMLADYGFLRCHQSHLVNRRYVKSLVKESGGYLLMTDGSEVPLSRHKKEEIKMQLMKPL